MQAEKMIKQYPEWKRELTVIRNQLCSYDGVNENEVIDSMCYVRTKGYRVQISELPDTTAQAALIFRERAEAMSDEWYEYLMERYQLLAEEVEFFEQTVHSLSGKLSEVMYDLIMAEMLWKELATKYKVSETMIGKYRKKALKEMEIAYGLRDRQVESYILS